MGLEEAGSKEETDKECLKGHRWNSVSSALLSMVSLKI